MPERNIPLSFVRAELCRVLSTKSSSTTTSLEVRNSFPWSLQQLHFKFTTTLLAVRAVRTSHGDIYAQDQFAHCVLCTVSRMSLEHWVIEVCCPPKCTHCTSFHLHTCYLLPPQCTYMPLLVQVHFHYTAFQALTMIMYDRKHNVFAVEAAMFVIPQMHGAAHAQVILSVLTCCTWSSSPSKGGRQLLCVEGLWGLFGAGLL